MQIFAAFLIDVMVGVPCYLPYRFVGKVVLSMGELNHASEATYTAANYNVNKWLRE